ncbi:MAG: FHA domain-containing protein [Planctomycetota bacterium]
MFSINLLQTNGPNRSKRVKVGQSPFTIGRAKECSLSIETRTISRTHASIIFDQSNVLIRDHRSRNGTRVNGERLDPDVPRQLGHHDILQLGKFAFRISIRDAKTKEPHQPYAVDLSTLADASFNLEESVPGTSNLLSELDELASKLKPFDGSPENGDLSKNSDSGRTRPQATGTEESASSAKEGGTEESGEQSTLLIAPQESSLGSDDVATDEDSSEENGVPLEKGKLPDHLRPKGPKDSQDAAATALKNLFR